MSECNEEFVFTWTIVNYFFCGRKCGEYLSSPNIFANNFYKTDWFLRLYPRGEIGSPEFVSMELLSDEDYENPVEINFKIELCNSEEKVFAYADKKKAEISNFEIYSIKNIISIEKLVQEMKNSTKDSLIIRCYLFVPKSVVNERTSKSMFSAKTEICFNKLSFPWDLPPSKIPKSPDCNVTEIFSINEKTQLSINLKAHNDTFLLEIKQITEETNYFYPCKCEIILFDKEDIERVSCRDSFTFKEEFCTWNFPQFLNRSLVDEKSDLCLRFNFTISNGLSTNKYTDDTKCLQSSSSGIKNSNSPVLSSLQDDLRAVLLNKRHSDVSFRIESEIVSAHKCILASRSPFFSNMFEHDLVVKQTGVIYVSDMSVQTLRLFLEFLYTEEIEDLNWESALDLFPISEKYQVFSLKEKCSEFLKNTLNTDNICDVVSVADMVGHQVLKTAAMDYIKENSTEVLGSKKWLEWIEKNVKLCSEIFFSLSQEFKTIQKNV